jgi:NAD+ synthetase
MIIGRSEPLDYKSVFETIVNVTSDYVKNCGIKTMVLGLSGGLDSTVCAAICKKVSEKNGVKLIGVSLPCSTNKEDEKTSASLAGKEFCDEYIENNIQDVFVVAERACEGIAKLPSTGISQGNIKARLRMIVLYDIASKMRGIVIGTSNTTERLTGFWTLHGDEGDINPIGDLWKTEVYDLAEYLYKEIYKDSAALKAAIEIVPTDGNGVSASDADQIMPGYTYYDIDLVLSTWNALSPKIKNIMMSDGLTKSIKGTVFAKEPVDERNKRIEFCKKSGVEFKDNLGTIYGEELVRKVILRSLGTEFKRNRGEIAISLTGSLNGQFILFSNMPKTHIFK